MKKYLYMEEKMGVFVFVEKGVLVVDDKVIVDKDVFKYYYLCDGK